MSETETLRKASTLVDVILHRHSDKGGGKKEKK